MKKVLFCATVVKTHINVFHTPYLQWFKEHGYETYVCAKNDYSPNECVIPYCDHFIEIPFSRSPFSADNVRAFSRLRKLIKKEKFDLIHCHTPTAGVISRLAAAGMRKHGTKVFYTAHGFHFYKGSSLLSKLVFYPAEWLCSFFTDVLILINDEDYELAITHLHAKKAVKMNGVGIDFQKFVCGDRSKSEIRAELNIPGDVPVLLNVGELIERKNQGFLIKTLSDIENAFLVICGSGRLENDLSELAEKYGVSDRVIFAGFRSDIPNIMKASDIFVFPSLQEGLPIALAEAMACSMPCIASDIRGCRDLIVNGINGLLFSLNNQDEFIKSVTQLFEDSMLRRELGIQAAHTAAKYGISRVLPEMAELYTKNLK